MGLASIRQSQRAGLNCLEARGKIDMLKLTLNFSLSCWLNIGESMLLKSLATQISGWK